MKNLKVTIVQSDIFWENPQKNLENFSKKIESISQQTNLIVLPEMFSTGFSMQPQIFEKNLSEKIINFLKIKAAEKNAAITGSVIHFENDKYFNRLVFVYPSGEYLYYDKRHLFSFAGEDKIYTPGNKELICDTENWRIKPLICYDLRFPVWSRNKNDYDILIYVANWPQRRIDAWDILLKARAVENQSYVIAVNRTGLDGNNIEHSGNSKIIDPKGNIIAETAQNSESIVSAELNYAELLDFRNKFRAADDADSFSINY